MRLAINIYRSKRWEMTKKEACWDGLGSWKSPEIRGSGLLERPTPTANAEGIQKRSSAGEPGYCRRAMEDSEAVSTLIGFISHKLGRFGLQWAGKSTGAKKRRKKNQARELVTYLEELWKNLSCQARVWQGSQGKEDRDRGELLGKWVLAHGALPSSRGCDIDTLPCCPPTEEMFVVTNLHLIIHVPGDFSSLVHEQFMRIPFDWILTRTEPAALEISSC